MREMGFTSEFRRGYLTVVLKEEHNLNRLCISSMVSCKGTMALRSVSHSGFEVHLPTVRPWASRRNSLAAAMGMIMSLSQETDPNIK